jgi:hypothetical protein
LIEWDLSARPSRPEDDLRRSPTRSRELPCRALPGVSSSAPEGAPGRRGQLSARTDAASLSLDAGRGRRLVARGVAVRDRRRRGRNHAAPRLAAPACAPHDAAHGVRRRRKRRDAPGGPAGGRASLGRGGPASAPRHGARDSNSRDPEARRRARVRSFARAAPQSDAGTAGRAAVRDALGHASPLHRRLVLAGGAERSVRALRGPQENRSPSLPPAVPSDATSGGSTNRRRTPKPLETRAAASFTARRRSIWTNPLPGPGPFSLAKWRPFSTRRKPPR